TITYLSDIGCLEIQGASLGTLPVQEWGIYVLLLLLTYHCSLIQAFYANTVIIFLKPEGLFRLSSPPALGEGSRRFFAD
uniref:hypothetical protein n=1 Tax=Escherichia coli TaxID=562 RepID=UPI001FCD59B6